MMDEQLEPAAAKQMLRGGSDPLNSAFYLGYNMLLNLLRVEEHSNPLKLMSRSFHQFQSTRRTPQLKQELELLTQQHAQLSLQLNDLHGIAEYVAIETQIATLRERLRSIWNIDNIVVPYFNEGRLIRVRATPFDASKKSDAAGVPVGDASPSPSLFEWGVILTSTKATKSSRNATTQDSYVVECLLHIESSTAKQIPLLRNQHTSVRPSPVKVALPSPAGTSGPDAPAEWACVPIQLCDIDCLSSVKIKVGKLREIRQSQSERLRIATILSAVDSKFGSPVLVPQLTAIEMKCKDDKGQLTSIYNKVESLAQRQRDHAWHTKPEAQEQRAIYNQRQAIDARIAATTQAIATANCDIAMTRTLESMQGVLRRLDYVTAGSRVIDLKGRVAAEISTCDELVATELIFTGAFAQLTIEQTVALCSCLVFNEKTADDVVKSLSPQLASPFRVLQETARRVAQVQIDSRLPLDCDEFCLKFSPALMEVCAQWCSGAKFSEICKLSTVFEGSIIRAMRRLEELLRQLASACKAIGNAPLEEKFTKGIQLIKRDIVFSASLYL